MYRLALPVLLGMALLAIAQPAPKSYRLPGTDLKQPIIWGNQVDLPDGTTLSFGGQDQKGDDGASRTRLRVDGKWLSLTDELRKANPLQGAAGELRKLADDIKGYQAEARRAYLDGIPEASQRVLLRLRREVIVLGLSVEIWKKENENSGADQVRRAREVLPAGGDLNLDDISPKSIQRLASAERSLRTAADLLDAEPAPRALSPLVYDAKTGLVVLFGGDHLDYLTADTWVYNPKQRRWTQRHPESAPPPRANHTLKASGDGLITLDGGYTYTSNTDYMGGQYRDLADGPWTYDIAANKWTGPKPGGPPAARTYRTGPFDPAFFLAGDKPDAATFQKTLADLPPNTWRKTSPPQLPQMNRDWGTAILDPDRDLILRWSGGHCAHGGSDVLHYHLASNRWELPCFVEFPLGQLYTNTEYPEGWNFNHRPWVTGHTYQNYGYDPLAKVMLFTGQHRYEYRYAPDVADWVSPREEKPAAMVYNGCFYTLTTTTTPHGLVCWTQAGKVLHRQKDGWREIVVQGKLPGAVVDNSTLTWDAKRERLLFVVKPYGKPPFDGQVWALDWATKEAKPLDPKGRPGVAELPYLCQLRYHPEQDIVLAAAWLDPDPGPRQRMAAYDPAGNRWVSLAIGGDDPFGKSGRNVSLGLVYDPKRKLFWAVDTRSQVFVLRLDVSKSDLKPLGE
jgi:hypothetical protein